MGKLAHVLGSFSLKLRWIDEEPFTRVESNRFPGHASRMSLYRSYLLNYSPGKMAAWPRDSISLRERSPKSIRVGGPDRVPSTQNPKNGRFRDEDLLGQVSA